MFASEISSLLNLDFSIASFLRPVFFGLFSYILIQLINQINPSFPGKESGKLIKPQDIICYEKGGRRGQIDKTTAH
jgi:hypothetical protein